MGSYEDGRVFILGAGFSADAGVPLTEDLLRQSTQLFRVECNGIYQRLENYARDIVDAGDSDIDFGAIGFSRLCTYLEFAELREFGGGERWSDDGSREKMALRFYLAKTIVSRTPVGDRVPELYLKFCSQLKPEDMIITFNWDCLIENTLIRLGTPYSYCFEEKKLNICKLHGSVHWICSEPNDLGTPKNTLDWRPLGYKEGLVEHEIFVSDMVRGIENWAGRGPFGEVRPCLVLPGYGKAFDVRKIAGLWYKPEFAFLRRGGVHIIGLGLAGDDYFVNGFLRYCFANKGLSGHRVTVINPDKKTEESYSFMLGENRQMIMEKFSEKHIDIF